MITVERGQEKRKGGGEGRARNKGSQPDSNGDVVVHGRRLRPRPPGCHSCLLLLLLSAKIMTVSGEIIVCGGEGRLLPSET